MWGGEKGGRFDIGASTLFIFTCFTTLPGGMVVFLRLGSLDLKLPWKISIATMKGDGDSMFAFQRPLSIALCQQVSVYFLSSVFKLHLTHLRMLFNPSPYSISG